MNNSEKQPITKHTIVIRAIGFILLVAAIAYIILPFDFDNKGVIGYIDDFLFFMAAFTLLRASFTPPKQRFVKRQFYIISTVCFIMGFLWLGALATLL